MQDFIRIGGPIVSYPLNENFRRLLNAISIANTNLVFSDEDGIKNDIQDMNAIEHPTNGQVCYVVSSGELYRYSAADEKWHKIMDIGQTFRQAFLNSGAVILHGAIETTDNQVLKMPEALIYYKNKPGDGRYLKGMYRIAAQDIDISDARFGIETGGAYSIYVECTGLYSIIEGMPMKDWADRVFIGSFIVDSNLHIYDIFTLPDIAYTADRGHFIINGGQSDGLNLIPRSGTSNKVSRTQGSYYDEGINYKNAEVDSYPSAVDDGSNYNLKDFVAVTNITDLRYLYPTGTFTHAITSKATLDYNHYYDGNTIASTGNGKFTIQRHLITPNGHDYIIYGDTLYNSMDDAFSHINDIYEIDVAFPFVEATRIVVGTGPNGEFNITQDQYCKMVVMGRLSQIGTFDPEFADDEFKIYDGTDSDVTPASMRFDLMRLREKSYSGNTPFKLIPLSQKVTRDGFHVNDNNNAYHKYIQGNETSVVTDNTQDRTEGDRKVGNDYGYELADKIDIDRLHARVSDIETEIWNDKKASGTPLYNESIRYRLWKDEDDISNKVNTSFLLNGHALTGDHLDLVTGDIAEGGSPANLWYTDTRVENNSHVNAAYTHIDRKGNGTESNANPHAMSTDDITVGNNKFVTATQKTMIDNMPSNTVDILNGPIQFGTIAGGPTRPGAQSEVVRINTIKLYDDYLSVNVDANNKKATIGIDDTLLMSKAEFATAAAERPDLYGGMVDKAIVAEGVSILDNATASQYYGTDENGVSGVYDLPVYVSTASAEDYTSADETAFEPIDHSVVLKHLANSRVSYPASYEETTLGTNVYDLVKNHYHKVFNSGLQGPYVDGTQTQDVSKIYYAYKVPSRGLSADTYYFSYGNDNYSFTTAAIAANKELRYTPSTGKLTLDGNEIAITAVAPTAVDETKWLSFVSQTDWNNINEWNFGNNLTVTVDGNKATVNATVANSGVGNFVNLGDVSVTYSDANLGKMLILDKINGQYKITWGIANMAGLMRSVDYVGASASKTVHKADLATSAETSAKLQNTYTVDDSHAKANNILWSSNKIVSNVSTQIANEGVRTYSGFNEPTPSIGKDGDLYILLED